MTTTATAPELDERDQRIMAERVAELDKVTGPREGDYVEFADGITRRISYIWGDGIDGNADGVQTSDGGSFYLGTGYVSFSGSLYTSTPYASLTLTDERKPGRAWFFHHDWHTAGGGVDVMIPFRVYRCDRPATR